MQLPSAITLLTYQKSFDLSASCASLLDVGALSVVAGDRH